MTRPCRTCAGAKTFAFRTCGHHGNCPCGEYEELPCDRCGGSGVELCSECSRPLDERDVDGICSACEDEHTYDLMTCYSEYISEGVWLGMDPTAARDYAERRAAQNHREER